MTDSHKLGGSAALASNVHPVPPLRIRQMAETIAVNQGMPRGGDMDDVVRPPALSELIGDIYDCVLEPSRWRATLTKVARFVGCERAILSLNDLLHDRVLIGESAGWEPPWLAERNRHAPEIHMVLSDWLAREPGEDEPFVASRVLPDSAMRSSAYVRGCLRPLGIADVAHYFLIRTPLHFSELVLARQDARGPFMEEDIEAGKLLLPHLRRAVTISNVLDAKLIERRRMAETLDALRCSVLLTDAHGTIVHANRAAERMLREGDVLQSQQGVLRAQQPVADRELQHAISLGAHDETRLGNAAVAIRLNGLDQSPVLAHVLPLRGSNRRIGLQPEAIAAVFIGPKPEEPKHIKAFAVAFRLTPAESRVIAALIAGRTLTETAQVLGVGRATAKTQLESVFQKTGVSRQGELIRLVMQAMGPTEAMPPPAPKP